MSGIRRPPLSPHHSSTIQSLYARTHASRELAVLRLEERLAAEARERREAERRLDPVHLHVVDARLRVVATGAHLVVGDRRHRHVVAVEADRGDVALVDVDEVFVDPAVGLRAALVERLLVGAAADVLHAPMPRRSTCGPAVAERSRAASVCQRCAGSTTWSSTLMILGSSLATCAPRPNLTTVRFPGDDKGRAYSRPQGRPTIALVAHGSASAGWPRTGGRTARASGDRELVAGGRVRLGRARVRLVTGSRSRSCSRRCAFLFLAAVPPAHRGRRQPGPPLRAAAGRARPRDGRGQGDRRPLVAASCSSSGRSLRAPRRRRPPPATSSRGSGRRRATRPVDARSSTDAAIGPASAPHS